LFQGGPTAIRRFGYERSLHRSFRRLSSEFFHALGS
jgi:hypothetical protein